MGVESCFDLFEPEVRVCFIKCRKFCDSRSLYEECVIGNIPFFVRRSCAIVRPWHLGVILCHFESFFCAKGFPPFQVEEFQCLGLGNVLLFLGGLPWADFGPAGASVLFVCHTRRALFSRGHQL